MKKGKIFLLVFIFIIVVLAVFFIFFDKKEFKNSKMGDNITNQDIVDYILNISYFEAKIEVEVHSNKNVNKYIMKQKYKKFDAVVQEILEPSNISGVKITKSEKQLKIENTTLNLSTIFENYSYMSDNCLDLNSFIDDYKLNQGAEWIEEENMIVMLTCNDGKNKKLYVDKSTLKPVKLIIQDINRNAEIYILYNEIDVK